MKAVTGTLVLLTLLAGIAFGSPPDDWGYRFVTSMDPGGPSFAWREISVVGQHVPLLDDDNKGPFNLGFQFPFYGQPYGSLFVCSNGWASFTSESHQFHHFSIPSHREPNSLLAPFWTDLDPALAGSVFVHQFAGELVVSWVGVPHRRGAAPFSFQAVLLADSTLLFQYLSMDDSTYRDSSSVGIEDQSGAVGLSYFFDGTPDSALEDSLAVLFFTVNHDVNPIVIHSPLEAVFTGVAYSPAASIRNYGNNAESPMVIYTVSDSATLLPLHADTVSVASIDPRETLLIRFGEWTPDEGSFLVRFITDLSVNDDPSLDTLQRYVRASSHADMARDDGTPEGWYIVSGSPVSIMGLAVRFEPPYVPYRAIRGKILVSNTLPFEAVYLSPDDGTGVPDLDNPYSMKADIRADSDSTWAYADFDVTVRSGDDVWLVIIWPRGAVGPLVGVDATPPVDSCSFYTVYPPMWNQYATGDWIMRIEIDDDVGVNETALSPGGCKAYLTCSPSPFSSNVKISAAWSGTLHSLEIHDAAGRLVKSFDKSSGQKKLVVWDAVSRNGQDVRSGSYFVTLETEETSITHKIILVRR